MHVDITYMIYGQIGGAHLLRLEGDPENEVCNSWRKPKIDSQAQPLIGRKSLNHIFHCWRNISPHFDLYARPRIKCSSDFILFFHIFFCALLLRVNVRSPRLHLNRGSVLFLCKSQLEPKANRTGEIKLKAGETHHCQMHSRSLMAFNFNLNFR